MVFPEDLSEGQILELGSYTIEEDEIIGFGRSTIRFQFI